MIQELDWLRSTRCETGACVEIAYGENGEVHVRDGKLGKLGPVLTFTREEWEAFRGGVLAGEFNIDD